MKTQAKFSLLLLFVALSSFSFNKQTDKQENSVPVIAVIKPEQSVDTRILIGEWIRTDAPYQLKITDVLESGKLDVAYFNPKSIDLGKTYWMKTETILSVYIELQDENYPDSYYKLNYNTERDVLVGQYFQIDGGTSFPVEFVRTKQ